ncbi:XRN 5'-3' exonuclease N-terminus family protein [Babesia bovis T2Bo]|uniref:5'-3' exoribonuclease n=1 Tax=Babesia bovis TaxID=5865 RepID=A7ATB8_BABBO|nr:XRN 5'-3' exonuclease N-terminus family protein [Babesia bovis T2Bo]EDO06179.1 XRN 5'-3' exonuclease N-terminus family protein [Babesia bovis T2Bo]|eukprot:XP_001609747.1 XRN 5'-3' exonuclease protein [Babesia bovis T2Bo]
MGVPTFYRWLCSRYPRVVHDAKDDSNENNFDFSDLESYGLALLSPNPNGEFDNLYIDMNGLIHPCCHPEGLEQPPSEEVMFQCIFDYLDRLMYIIRPRKILFLAIDGVAPRAKMNQQRSRRFKSAAEADLEAEIYSKVAAEFAQRNVRIPPKESRWDSNVITPGTPFMHELSKRVVAYIKERRDMYEAWSRIHVIYSDANSPGEGEHKIMNFIRNQRHSDQYDPNTKHVLHGMDADLIMLGLATHEVNFYIIREIVSNLNPTKKAEDEIRKSIAVAQTSRPQLKDIKSYRSMLRQNWKPLQFLRLPVLREYLSHQLYFPRGWSRGNSGPIDFERCIDDLVLMCFFCGNDFLPHLPSISIQGGSIDQMILLYQSLLPDLGDYLTNEGEINFPQLGAFVSYIANVEDQVFKAEQEFKQRQKMRRLQHSGDNTENKDQVSRPTDFDNAGGETVLKNQDSSTLNNGLEIEFKKRCAELLKQEREVDDPVEPIDLSLNDPVRWKETYYRKKFGLCESQDVWEFASQVANHYIKGMCWVLRYYYQGCTSWGWYYPFHYAPFCSDLNFEGLEFTFDYGKPFTPFQQLMSVMPIRSSHCLPEQLRHLMTDTDSPIADFYPIKFDEDPNGKRYKYQWVALLPFIDEKKLLNLVIPIEAILPKELQDRNSEKKDMLFANPAGPTLVGQIEDTGTHTEFVSCSDMKHRSCLLKGALVPANILKMQDLMEEGRTRGFNCETAKRMISNVIGSGGRLHNHQSNRNPSENNNNEILRPNARDFHQKTNAYSTQMMPTTDCRSGISKNHRGYDHRNSNLDIYPTDNSASQTCDRKPIHRDDRQHQKGSWVRDFNRNESNRYNSDRNYAMRTDDDHYERGPHYMDHDANRSYGRKKQVYDDQPSRTTQRRDEMRTHGSSRQTLPLKEHSTPYSSTVNNRNEGYQVNKPDYKAGHKLERPSRSPPRGIITQTGKHLGQSNVETELTRSQKRAKNTHEGEKRLTKP